MNTWPTSFVRRTRRGEGVPLRSGGYSEVSGERTPDASSVQADSQDGGRDRRVAERFDLNNASGSLVHKGARIPCLMVDISLTGCCVRTASPFTAGSMETVKVTFTIFEMVLSIWGVTQWVRGAHLLGIHFRHPNPLSKNQLAGLLTCLIDGSAAEVIKKAMAEIAADPGENPIIQLEHPPATVSAPKPESEPEPEPDHVELVEQFAAPQVQQLRSPCRPVLSSAEPVLSMETGDSPASLIMPGDDSVFGGDIVDLSLTGCLMRFSRLREVRPRAQAEVSFHVQGLPFRLACVTREMHDKRTLEIQFNQMSRRSRDDLNQVITEMIERNNRKKKAS
jgi:hypothetical protein